MQTEILDIQNFKYKHNNRLEPVSSASTLKYDMKPPPKDPYMIEVLTWGKLATRDNHSCQAFPKCTLGIFNVHPS